ncbi:hypothetical protein [Microbacterium rhizophilus]|uniref:hypothetical protein n=1 Tax=Microbacterium rhizophilus TaxID=3138934 RepID=UPI0031F18630
MSGSQVQNLIAGLEKLPAYEGLVFRACPDGAEFVRDGQVAVARGLVSATKREGALAQSPDVYAIASRNGRDVSLFSAAREEQEVVFLPGTTFALWHSFDVDGRTVRAVFEIAPDEKVGPEQTAALERDARERLTAAAPVSIRIDRFTGDLATA